MMTCMCVQDTCQGSFIHRPFPAYTSHISMCYIETLGMVLGMRLCLHVHQYKEVPHLKLLKKVQEKWFGGGGGEGVFSLVYTEQWKALPKQTYM